MGTRSWVSSVGTVALAMSMVACSGSDSATSVAPSPSTEVSSVLGTELIETRSTTVEDTAASASAATDVTVFEDVPGLDSDDRFCRAWSEFAGTFQALALASDLAADPSTAFHAELAAANVVAEAWLAMSAGFPAEVDPADRQAFLDDVIGPFADRANAAQATLITAGLSPQQLTLLGSLWLTTLADTGLGDPDVDVEVPDEMQPAFDAALLLVQGDTPPIVADQSLFTTAQAPETLAYISANCPDEGILAGVDAAG